MANPKTLKELIETSMYAPKANASGNDMSGFNNAYVQQQAQSPSFLPPAQPTPNPEDAINREIETQGKKSLEAQQGELNRQRELANIYAGAGAGQADLTPLLQYSSQMTGNDIAKGYKAPPTAEESAKQAMGIYSQIPKLQDQLSDNKLNLLKIKLQAAQRKGDQGRQSRFEESQDTKLYTDLRKDSQKISDTIADANTSIMNVGAALKPDEKGMVDAARVNMALSNFARLMGEKGVLTDQDTGRQLAPNAAMAGAKLQQYFTSNPGATKVSAKVVSSMVDALQEAKNALTETAKMKIGTLESTYGEPTAPTYHMYTNRGGGKMISSLKDKLAKNLYPEQAKAVEKQAVPSFEEWKASKK